MMKWKKKKAAGCLVFLPAELPAGGMLKCLKAGLKAEAFHMWLGCVGGPMGQSFLGFSGEEVPTLILAVSGSQSWCAGVSLLWTLGWVRELSTVFAFLSFPVQHPYNHAKPSSSVRSSRALKDMSDPGFEVPV